MNFESLANEYLRANLDNSPEELKFSSAIHDVTETRKGGLGADMENGIEYLHTTFLFVNL